MLPVHAPDSRGGRPRVDDRVCFNAIAFVLFTGIAWQHLPRELGCSPADRRTLCSVTAERMQGHAGALAHPTRRAILAALSDEQSELSPSGFARLKGVKTSGVAYHFRWLARDRLITLTRTRTG